MLPFHIHGNLTGNYLCTDIAWFDRKVLVTAKITIRGGEGGKEGKGKSFGQPTLIVSAAGNR